MAIELPNNSDYLLYSPHRSLYIVSFIGIFNQTFVNDHRRLSSIEFSVLHLSNRNVALLDGSSMACSTLISVYILLSLGFLNTLQCIFLSSLTLGTYYIASSIFSMTLTNRGNTC